MEDKSLLLECDFLLDALIIIFVKKKSGRLNLIRKGSFIIPLFLSFCNSIKMCQSVCADNCVIFDHNCNFMEKTQASTHSRDIWLGKDVFCFAQLRDFALGWSKKKKCDWEQTQFHMLKRSTDYLADCSDHHIQQSGKMCRTCLFPKCSTQMPAYLRQELKSCYPDEWMHCLYIQVNMHTGWK